MDLLQKVAENSVFFAPKYYLLLCVLFAIIGDDYQKLPKCKENCGLYLVYSLYIFMTIFWKATLTECFALLTWNLVQIFKASNEPLFRYYLFFVHIYCIFITYVVSLPRLPWEFRLFLPPFLILGLVYVTVCLQLAWLGMKQLMHDESPFEITYRPAEIVLPPNPNPLLFQDAGFVRLRLPNLNSSQQMNVDNVSGSPLNTQPRISRSETSVNEPSAVRSSMSFSTRRTVSFMTADDASLSPLNNEFLTTREANEMNEVFAIRNNQSSSEQRTISSMNVDSDSVFPLSTESISTRQESEMSPSAIRSSLSSSQQHSVPSMNVDNPSVFFINTKPLGIRQESEMCLSSVRSNPSSSEQHTFSSVNINNASVSALDTQFFSGREENEINELAAARSTPSSSGLYTMPSTSHSSVNTDARSPLVQENSSEAIPSELDVLRTRSGTTYLRRCPRRN